MEPSFSSFGWLRGTDSNLHRTSQTLRITAEVGAPRQLPGAFKFVERKRVQNVLYLLDCGRHFVNESLFFCKFVDPFWRRKSDGKQQSSWLDSEMPTSLCGTRAGRLGILRRDYFRTFNLKCILNALTPSPQSDLYFKHQSAPLVLDSCIWVMYYKFPILLGRWRCWTWYVLLSSLPC